MRTRSLIAASVALCFLIASSPFVAEAPLLGPTEIEERLSDSEADEREREKAHRKFVAFAPTIAALAGRCAAWAKFRAPDRWPTPGAPLVPSAHGPRAPPL